jgi:ATP-dependent RNA helicase DHX37/DHR1
MLLVSAQAGVLDYAVAMIAALSETSPFLLPAEKNQQEKRTGDESDDESLDDVDRNAADTAELEKSKAKTKRWTHKSGDVIAALLAVGGYSFAGHGAASTDANASRISFCEDNGLNPVVMGRIQKMRVHLARLVQLRLGHVDCVAARTGGVLKSMPPPNKLQEILLCQAIASGLLDNVAMLVPPGTIPGEYGYRSAYVGCSSPVEKPLFLDSNSVVYSKDWRLLPRWVCFDSLIQKTTNKGSTVTIMKTITPIDVEWLGKLAKGSRLLTLGEPLLTPTPSYDADKDIILCSVTTKYGIHGWEIPPIRMEMFPLIQTPQRATNFMVDDSFRWFARFLLEGKVLPELSGLAGLLNDDTSLITRKAPSGKVALLVSALSTAGIDSAAALRNYWDTVDNKYLFKHLKSWIKPEKAAEAKRLWIETVKRNVLVAKSNH